MLFALALCGLAACSRDSVDEVVAVADGNKANVRLIYDVNSSIEVGTRAAQSTYYEHLVQNIYVFVFNGDRRVELTKDYFVPADIEGYSDYIAGDEFQSSGKIEFGSISGSGLRICAIANIGTSNSVMGSTVTRATTTDTGSTDDGSGDVTTDADLAKLDAITSYTELKKLSVELKSNSIFRGASFLMTGEVTADLQATGTTEVKIPLTRADSKITFNVTAESTNFSDIKFIPGKWRVVNVPAVSYVLPHISTDDAAATLTEDKDATIDGSDFFSVSEAEAPQFEGTVGGAANSGTFTFYMYENLKKPAKGITEEPAFDQTVYEGNLKYALREKQTKTATTTGVSGQTYVNGEFEYAPEFGTYVVFTGELSYTLNKDTDNEQYVIADVEYCVHLGHDSVDNVNSYNTLRNHHYTYNVIITGVNSLVVEVDNDQEERPGAEGDVVISATEIHNVDGHYDRALITLSAKEASKLLFSVSTPFERGIDDMTGDAELKDYKWIKFLVNSEVSVGNTSYAAYPGDACYDGGASAQGAGAESGVYGKSVVLRDIRQLSNYFADVYKGKTDEELDGMDPVYITAFVDEYLYFYDPTTDDGVVTDGENTSTTYRSAYTVDAAETDNLLMWKKSVNTSDRMLHIVKAGDMKYSADGETSVSRSVVTFKQRPVLTFYNVAADGLTTAWGTETINETPKMTVSRTSYPSTTGYNYYQQAQRLTAYSGTNTQNSWADVISSTDQYGFGSNYNDPSYACAMRNRDFDGDGIIDENEVQWYLAALSQISDLYIGEPAMPSYAHLFDADNPDGYYTLSGYEYPSTHFVSSTIGDNDAWTTNASFPNPMPMVYWAEEYGATSTHADAIYWGQAPLKDGATVNKTWNGDKEDAIVAVRCVRNLGMAYSSTSTPQHYIQTESVTADGVTATRLKLDYINPTALRSVTDNGDRLPISVVNTATENNRPYGSFDVYPTLVEGTYEWYQCVASERDGDYIPNNDTEDGRICPAGWRVPTQREMLIMTNNLSWDNLGLNSHGATMINYQLIGDKTKTTTKIGAFYFTGRIITRKMGSIITSYITENTENLVTDYLYNTNYNNTGHNSAQVRCVRDNLDYTPPSPASIYIDGGSVTQ